MDLWVLYGIHYISMVLYELVDLRMDSRDFNLRFGCKKF